MSTDHDDTGVRDALDALHALRQRTRREALAGHGGVCLAGALAQGFDAALAVCFARAFDHAQGRAALLAVGGYGRATLAHGSDLDLVLLVDDPEAPWVEPFATAMLHPLWDAGIALGHAVRSVDDFVGLARTDVRTATTVLDARALAGDGDLAADAIARCTRAAFEGDLARFLDGLVDEMTARHRRFGATVYLLEPDVKHSRGGLRDLDIARWALRARYRTHDYDDALRAGGVTPAEHRALVDAREFQWRVRMALHARSGRRNDRLAFDEQEEAAARLIPADPDDHRDPEERLGEATERLMSGWYRHAREVSTAVDHVIHRCRPGRATPEHGPRTDRLADAIARYDGMLSFTHADALRRDPSLALRIFELALARNTPLASGTRAALAAATSDPVWCESLRADAQAAGAFRRLLAASNTARLRSDRTVPVSGTETNEGSVLAELHDLGLLLAMVPEFAHVTGRVQHDVYHVYTVDVHSVAAVDRLHAIARGDLAEEFPLPARLLVDTDRMDILCLATLVHDIGKSRGGSHAKIGAEMAPVIAARLGFGPDDAATIAWLVAEHLTLYHAATRRDLGDPATLTALVDTVRDPWRLRALYLLTVADLSTTSPTAMTQWKARMLDELYLRVDEALTAGAQGFGERVAALRAQSVARASVEDRGAIESLLARMPDRYVLANTPEAVLRHARALDGHTPGSRRVHIAPLEGEMTGELLEVLFAAPDRPGLLARFAALLYANRLDVQGAQIYSSQGDAVDVFVVRSTRTDAVELARTMARLPRQLDDLLDERADPDALVQATRGGAGIPRPEPAVRSEVHIEQGASATATVVEVFGRDRAGFLYGVTRALHRHGVEVSLAKVNTEGRRAADTFYVTDAHGKKLSDERAQGLRTALLDVVRGA